VVVWAMAAEKPVRATMVRPARRRLARVRMAPM